MSFSARSFAFFAALTLASVAACGDDSSSGSGAGGSGGDAAGPGSTSAGPGATSGGATSGGATSGGDVTSGSTTTSGSGDVTSGSSTTSSGSGDATTGAGGNDTTTSTATGDPDPGGCSIFCSDFEGGSLPSELQFFPEYQRSKMADFVTLDSTGHSGTHSVKVSGTDFSQMLGVAVPSNFWGRIYLKSATDIQMGHNTYVAAVEGNGDPNNGEQIRIGEHQCQLELNRKSDDKEMLSNGGMYMCSGGVKLVANTWYCLEFHYDGPGRSVSVFVDGAEVNAMHVTDWGPYDYKLFKFGFEKYHGGAKTMWYDDLALNSARVGCGK
ncbi:hypothetical protein WME90_34545 [Sorangium sp. So ce375]|uniref:hypothetical protein n=1 Tax=Sorangium sp. So ce375 TaxID=3133306 RepID=UPI003F5B4037